MTRRLRDDFRITNIWADDGVIMIRLVSQPAGPTSRIIEMPYSIADADRVADKLVEVSILARYQSLYQEYPVIVGLGSSEG